ncbi:dihydroorotate dehydrogenase, partial [Pseudomonas ogarae]
MNWLAAELAGRLPIIAAGGITEGRHAADKNTAVDTRGATYSGFLYTRPALVRASVDALAAV